MSQNIPGHMIGQGTLTLVLELDPLDVARERGQAGVTARQDLDAFLIRREEGFVGGQALSFPKARVQV